MFTSRPEAASDGRSMYQPQEIIMFRATSLAIALSVMAIASATVQAAAFPSHVLGGGQIGAELNNKYGTPAGPPCCSIYSGSGLTTVGRSMYPMPKHPRQKFQ